jgi:hypothetical protein
MGASLQRETNETVNQRRDNVSLVLNKRFIVKRGNDVDVQSLLRNTAGSVTMANNPKEDVVPMEWNDVTSSSYQEQDRLNVDYDELTGNFSSSSVMTNRKLNETVGGMQMLGQGANQLTEYLIRTLVETWVEPVLRQLVKLEQAYETDMVVLGLAGQKAQLSQKYGVDQITDELLNQELTTRVNVGMGATDPQTKLQKFTFAFQQYSGIAQSVPDADKEAVRKELFGLAGYKDGGRFFAKQQEGQPDPAQMAMQAQMQAEQQAEQAKIEAKGQIEQMKAQQKAESDAMKLEQKHAIEQMQLERDAEAERGRQEIEFAKASAKDEIDRAVAQAKFDAEEAQSVREMELEYARAKLQSETAVIVAGINAANKPVAEGQTAPKGPDMSAALTTALEGFQQAITQINRPRKLIRDAQGQTQGIE